MTSKADEKISSAKLKIENAGNGNRGLDEIKSDLAALLQELLENVNAQRYHIFTEIEHRVRKKVSESQVFPVEYTAPGSSFLFSFTLDRNKRPTHIYSSRLHTRKYYGPEDYVEKSVMNITDARDLLDWIMLYESAMMELGVPRLTGRYMSVRDGLK